MQGTVSRTEQAAEIAKWFADHPEAFGKYHLAAWNCKHFATFCQTTTLTPQDLSKALEHFEGSLPNAYLRKNANAVSRQAQKIVRRNVLKQFSGVSPNRRVVGDEESFSNEDDEIDAGDIEYLSEEEERDPFEEDSHQCQKTDIDIRCPHESLQQDRDDTIWPPKSSTCDGGLRNSSGVKPISVASQNLVELCDHTWVFNSSKQIMTRMSTKPCRWKVACSKMRRRSGQSVTASGFGSNGPRFESGRGRCVESLDKALYSHCPKEKPSQ